MVVARKRSSTWLRPELSGSSSRTSISVPTGISLATRRSALGARRVAPRARAHVVDAVAQIEVLRPRDLLLLPQLDAEVGHLVGQIVELRRRATPPAARRGPARGRRRRGRRRSAVRSRWMSVSVSDDVGLRPATAWPGAITKSARARPISTRCITHASGRTASSEENVVGIRFRTAIAERCWIANAWNVSPTPYSATARTSGARPTGCA